MSEYHYILSLYKKHKRYGRKVFLFSFVLIVLTSIFVGLDLSRINPFIYYMVTMGITIYFAMRIQVVSKNYGKLERVLKKYDRKMFKDKELLFFIDYQLAHSFEQESNELLKSSKDHKVSPAFEKTLLDIKHYYEYIKTDDLNEESKALSLKEYLALLQNSKQNLA